MTATSLAHHPWVWLDMEMTGLDPDNDRVLEVAVAVTDTAFNVLAKGGPWVVHQPAEVMEAMNPWCQSHHTASGLVEAVRASNHTEANVEQDVLAFLQPWVPSGVSPLCGNSVCQDRQFLRRYMPKLNSFFHYRHLDISTLKLLAAAWSPNGLTPFDAKASEHRALPDVLESIEEARYYQDGWLRHHRHIHPLAGREPCA